MVVTDGPRPAAALDPDRHVPDRARRVADLAIRVSQTGILLTLAFDIMLACLAAPFLLGLFWRAGGARRDAGGSSRSVSGCGPLCSSLTPTMYGVPNDLLYVPNSLGLEWLDGWSTLIAAAVAISTYVIIALARPRTEPEFAQEEAAVAELRARRHSPSRYPFPRCRAGCGWRGPGFSRVGICVGLRRTPARRGFPIAERDIHRLC